MTVYNINLGIGWANSGIEYAQAYRVKLLERLKVPVKVAFSNMLLANNLEELTSNLGLHDDQIIWLYNFFTDVKIAPTTYQLAAFEQGLAPGFQKKGLPDGKQVQYDYRQAGKQLLITARLDDPQQQTIDQVSYSLNGRLLQRDFYSYVKYASEYYQGTAGKNYVVARDFYNEDGQPAYHQYYDQGHELYQFADGRVLANKDALYRAMLQQLDFQANDVIIMDRLDEDKELANGELFLENHGSAKLVVPIHAEHYSKVGTTSEHILWNNFYDYQFNHPQQIDAYLFATPQERDLFVRQQTQYGHSPVQAAAIPVGSLSKLHYSNGQRKKHALITASRLAPEKHLDWLVQAVALARHDISDVTLDIYGQGPEWEKLQKLIEQLDATDYIRLMGQHDLTTTYTRYAAYASASTSEGFGLSLLEAVGSGLPIVGFDVPYGNPTFIQNGQTGYLIPYDENAAAQEKWQNLAAGIVKLFNHPTLATFHQQAYLAAVPYLDANVVDKWQNFLRGLEDAKLN